MDDTQQQAGNQQSQQPVPSQVTPPVPTSTQPQQSNTVFQFVKPQPTPTDDQTTQQPQPVQNTQQTVGSVPVAGKEGEPIPSPVDTTKWVESSEPEEVQLSPEIAEMGVSNAPTEMPEIKEEVQEAGVTYSPPVIPLAAMQNTDRIKLPMTEEEAKKVIAHPKPSNSLYWLALTMLRQLEWLKHNLQEKQV